MTTDAFAAEVDAEEQAAREAAIAQIPLYYRFNEEKKEAEENLRTLDPKSRGKSGSFTAGSAGPLRQWLSEHPEEELTYEQDGVGTLQARMLSGGQVTVVDNERLQAEQATVWALLDELGLLVVDTKKLKDALDKGRLNYGAVAGYIHEEPRPLRLDVNKL